MSYYSTGENTKIGDIVSSFKGTAKIGMVAKFTPKGVSCYYIHSSTVSDYTWFTDKWVHVNESKLPLDLQENIKNFKKIKQI